ncbi:MAG: hypothetical protein NVSMB29_05520 [Candidatus Dormibacteria bacterium]
MSCRPRPPGGRRGFDCRGLQRATGLRHHHAGGRDPRPDRVAQPRATKGGTPERRAPERGAVQHPSAQPRLTRWHPARRHHHHDDDDDHHHHQLSFRLAATRWDNPRATELASITHSHRLPIPHSRTGPTP